MYDTHKGEMLYSSYDEGLLYELMWNELEDRAFEEFNYPYILFDPEYNIATYDGYATDVWNEQKDYFAKYVKVCALNLENFVC